MKGRETGADNSGFDENTIVLESLDEQPLLTHQEDSPNDVELVSLAQDSEEGTVNVARNGSLWVKWKSVKVILISGVGFFSDAYDLCVLFLPKICANLTPDLL